ncbi:MAG: chromosome segregation protein SMC [Ruminococcaceae bacterium]|nr:chromosome segregation protein SMC [Oscillospiraceae bacterium]
MYLKALEIQGFKSFPDKTVLNFGEDVTAIVGPNGSGKSNVSDAIRWVMGEQSTKSLRGSKMEDVIFGGTEKRKQMGFAQVTLVLDNTEHIFPQMEESEVSVTRRYYRSGESEYYINKQAVRLTDVNELFMDTGMGREGYSIIGQGRIDEILSQKSADRREIFEEAAGISKYRHRKERAERDLERTEENLTRVNDKIAELEPQVEHLRAQAETAKKYLVLRGELRSLEISLWLDQLDVIRTGAIRIETDLAQAREELDRAKADLDGVYAENEKFGDRIRENDIQQDGVRGELSALDRQIGEQESAISVLETNITHNNDSIARAESELQNQSGRAGTMAEQIEEKKRRIAELEAESARVGAELDALQKKAEEISRGVGEATDEATRLRGAEALELSAAADCRAAISAARTSITEREERRGALSTEKESVEAQLGEWKSSAAANRRALDEAQEELNAIQNIIKGHSMKMQGRVQREQDARDRSVNLEMELSNLDSKIKLLSDMEKEYEGFANAVRVVMMAAQNKTLHGIHGPVANLITTENRYAVAIEIALGAKLQDIVVDREEDAKAAINLLKQRNSGRATFQPLTAIRGAELREAGLESEYGFIGVASQLVKYDEKYRAVFASMLGNTVVVEDLDCGITIARKYQNRFRIVTLDGQVVNRGGSMTGGSLNRNVGILSRANELKELTGKRGTLEEKRLAAQREAEEAKRELKEAQYQLEVAQSQEHEAEDKVLKLSGDKNHFDVMLSAARDRLENIEAEEEKIGIRLLELRKAIAEQEALAAKHEAQAAQLKAEAEKKLSGQSELMRSGSELGDEITGKKSQLAGWQAERETTLRAQRDLEEMQEQLRGDEADKRNLIGQYREANQRAEDEIASRRARVQELDETKRRQSDVLAHLAAAKLEIEKERGQNERRTKDLNEHVLNASGAVSRLEQRRESSAQEEKQIVEKLWENYELSQSAAAEQRVELESMTKANRRIAELKRSISALGTVNAGAIEEFERVNGRYTYLADQRDDVERAKQSLLGVINSIIGEMEEIFREQFGLIRESFQETFLELFGGGHATLELEDEKDILNCGIEIKVQPPGKALKTITLLSGGEKAFVAIALYFAILKVHPTPFCIMDEIDAALDTANVIRVSSYMRGITDKTQFIIITHRRETMEASDILYGVTMQERGVSKVIMLNLDNISKDLGIEE